MSTIFRQTIKAFGLFYLFCFVTSCQVNDQQKTAAVSPQYGNDSLYIATVLSFDTSSQQRRAEKINEMLASIPQTPQRDSNPWYNYFKAYQYDLRKSADSSAQFYHLMNPSPGQTDLLALKDYVLFNNAISTFNIAKAELVSQTITAAERAEKNNSVFVYRLYDLLAKAYYNNANINKSIEYTQKYYAHHPFKDHPAIRQRYFDICFMLAAQQANPGKMQAYLDSARAFARLINDSLALARTYDYESQVYSIEQEPAKAVESQRKYFNFLAQHGQLNKIAFNNLATSFTRNNQPDSAIHYYQLCIEWANQQTSNVNLQPVYEGLHESYKKKGNYKEALAALHHAFNIYGANKENIEAAKIEELHTQYQTEKKDQAIASLQTTNNLNRKIINQQRWIFVTICCLLIAVASYGYVAYRQKLLKEKNERLATENKRLILEQKTRQMQLNPHFIYNAIANLQGLISDDKKYEANAYLVAFSKLMRDILELNRNDLVTLEDEARSLKNYIELQQMRYENAFDYEIEDGYLDSSELLIPPMLIQPFVENSIEHGFKAIDYKGRLVIRFREEPTRLVITIEDNGSGANAVVQNPTGKKSLSRIITQERLNVLFNQQSRQAWFESGPKTEGTGFFTVIYLPIQIA